MLQVSSIWPVHKPLRALGGFCTVRMGLPCSTENMNFLLTWTSITLFYPKINAVYEYLPRKGCKAAVKKPQPSRSPAWKMVSRISSFVMVPNISFKGSRSSTAAVSSSRNRQPARASVRGWREVMERKSP